MSTHRMARRPRTAPAAAAVAASLALLAGCTGVTYSETPVPTRAATTTAAPSPTTPGASPTTPAECSNATQSYDPLPSVPKTSAITDRAVRDIVDRGYLVVGVSADTYLFAARNPLSGRIEGFDIDVAREVAKSLLGSPDKIRLRVITADDRIPLLQSGEVDLVIRTMTMRCDRWEQVAFSAEYYRSGQKVLVTKGSEAQTLEDLAGKRVCAPTGTTSLAKLRSIEGPIPVTAANHTGCLVLFQEGKVDAITGDDTVLAGLAAQDPYAVVSDAPAITAEPYGIAAPKEDVYLVRYLNALLEDMKADGRWKAIYTRWLAGTLGPAPAPPKPEYGR